jgi:hypothetical protein
VYVNHLFEYTPPQRYGARDLEVRYTEAVDDGSRASPSEVAQHAPLIAEAAVSKLSEGRSTAAGSGSFTYYCYLFDPETGDYAEIDLEETGDREGKNPSPARSARSMAPADSGFVHPGPGSVERVPLGTLGACHGSSATRSRSLAIGTLAAQPLSSV